MNSFDNDKVRAIDLARARLANARSTVNRWRNWSIAISATFDAARLLGDVVDVMAFVDFSDAARTAGESIESDIANAFATFLGVDVLASIKAEAEPAVVHEGYAVYHVAPGRVQVLPTGFDVRPVNSGPAWLMTEPEAITAFEAIAIKRLRNKCECDDSVGFECRRCKRAANRVRRVPSVDPWQRERDVAYRWARIAVKQRKVRQCQVTPNENVTSRAEVQP